MDCARRLQAVNLSSLPTIVLAYGVSRCHRCLRWLPTKHPQLDGTGLTYRLCRESRALQPSTTLTSTNDWDSFHLGVSRRRPAIHHPSRRLIAAWAEQRGGFQPKISLTSFQITVAVPSYSYDRRNFEDNDHRSGLMFASFVLSYRWAFQLDNLLR